MRLRLNNKNGLSLVTRLLVFICTLLIVGQGVATAVAYTTAQRRVSQQLSSDLNDLTSEYVDSLTQRMESYGDLLYATRGLFAAAQVDAATWDSFILAQSTSKRYAGMQTLAYAEIVPDSQLAKYEHALQTTQRGDIKIHPQNSNGQHVILTYFKEMGQPEPNLQNVLGYDMAASAERLDALERAKSTGSIAATSRITMVPIGNPGLLLALPLSQRFGNQTAGQQVFGYVIAAFSVDKLINNTMGSRLDRYHTSLTIRDVTDTQRPIMTDRPIAAPGDAITQVATIKVGDRTWEMTFKTPKSSLLLPAQRYAPIVALATGTALITATCVGAYAVRLHRRLKK